MPAPPPPPPPKLMFYNAEPAQIHFIFPKLATSPENRVQVGFSYTYFFLFPFKFVIMSLRQLDAFLPQFVQSYYGTV
jgi:hypothetical protein